MAQVVQIKITVAIGHGVPLLLTPTIAAAIAARENWIKPRTDEAAPALEAKGDIAPAFAPGTTNASDVNIIITGQIIE